MTSATYVVRAPLGSGRTSIQSTATNFLRAVKERHAGQIARLPIRGGRTAKFRKVDPLDCLSMTVHEAVTIIESSPDLHAVEYVQAIIADAGKDDAIAVRLARVERPSSLLEAEADLAASFGTVVCAIDQIRQHKSLIA